VHLNLLAVDNRSPSGAGSQETDMVVTKDIMRTDISAFIGLQQLVLGAVGKAAADVIFRRHNRKTLFECVQVWAADAGSKADYTFMETRFEEVCHVMRNETIWPVQEPPKPETQDPASCYQILREEICPVKCPLDS
jgi:hypothetical protein